MTKILVVNTAGMGLGGITSHMLTYLGALRDARSDCTIDIVVTGARNNEILNHFDRIGCHLFEMPDRKKHLVKYIYELAVILRKRHYDVIHVHGNSSLMLVELLLARRTKIPVRIAHCHNTICKHMKLHRLLKSAFDRSYTTAVACSLKAGDWLFGRGQFTVLPNAIDLPKYHFDSTIRTKYRAFIGASDNEVVIGHVGNFNHQKNQGFLLKIIEVSRNISDMPKLKLILLGAGALEDEIKEAVNKLGLEDCVTFLGFRNDVERWLQCMDVFMLPSYFEGSPVSLIEAQAAGLPCLVSDSVTDDLLLTNNVYQMSLSSGARQWAEKLRSIIMSKSNYERRVPQFLELFDIHRCEKQLEHLYQMNEQE